MKHDLTLDEFLVAIDEILEYNRPTRAQGYDE